MVITRAYFAHTRRPHVGHTWPTRRREGVRCGASVVATSSFAALLRQHRQALGLTQEELAERAGLSARAISDLERGLKQAPRPSTVRLLVRGLGLPDAEAVALLRAAQAQRATVLDTGPSHDRHNLPLPLSSFVGREQELDAVGRLLERDRLVTLTGGGGIGKTRLALRLAADLVAAYADGVWQVELAPLVDPALVPQTVGTVLGVREQPGRSLADTLAEALRPKQLLLVLDNCEHLIAACAALAEALLRDCPELRILATSREPLGSAGETIWRVLPLEVPHNPATRHQDAIAASPAVRLFVDRAQAVEPTFRLTAANAAVVAELCQRLEGIPLELELAASRAQVLAPAQILTRLDEALRLLVSGRRTAPPRQQALRATFDWSYALLSDVERRVLERLAIFAGGCTLEAAEAVCGMDGLTSMDVLDALGQVVAKSLVDVEPGAADAKRYRLHVLLRHYLSEHLARRGELERTRRQHARYFASMLRSTVMEVKGPLQSAWFQQLEREHANLRAALDWALASGETDTGLRLGAGLWRFWVYRGYLEEGEQWLTSLLARPAADSVDRLVVTFGAGMVAYYRGEPTVARARYEALHRAATATGDWERLTGALTQLGQIALDEDDLERAQALYSESLAIRQEHGDDWGTAISYSHLAALSQRRRDTVAARGLFERALSLSRAVGDTTGVATHLLSLGHLDMDRHDRAAAEHRFAESLRLFRELGNHGGIASALEGMARLALVTGDAARGFRLLGAAAALRGAAGVQGPPARRRVEVVQAANIAREMLGEAAAKAAEVEGNAQSPDEAAEEALARSALRT